MKNLKFDHHLAGLILSGSKRTTWRMFDDQDIQTGDTVELIDKVDPADKTTWISIGTAHIDRVTETTPAGLTETELHSHGYNSIEEMVAAFRSYYDYDVSLTTRLKVLYFTLDRGSNTSNAQNTTTMSRKFKIFCDGGSRGNPGPSAGGFIILDNDTDNILMDEGIYLGVTSNNQAEYLALKAALEAARRTGGRELHIYLDSMLVVNQMKGIFKVKNRDLWPVHEAIKELLGSFKRVEFTHIPREQNTQADAAVNRVLDARQAELDNPGQSS
jgi:ribonuclease HI